MDIRFCAITNESIPDGEFEAGRAITVGNKSYYVSAALQRLMSRSRVRGWLTFLLVVYAAGVTTFLLAAELKRETPDPNAVPAAVTAAIDAKAEDLQRALTGAVNTRLAQVNGDVGTAMDGAKAHREKIHGAVASIAQDIDKQEQVLNQRLESMDKRQSRIEDELTAVRDWRLEIQSTANDLMRRQAELESDRAAAPEAAEPPERAAPIADDDPGPGAAERTEEHERQLRMWIDRLRDKNHDVVFTATVKLADLGDVRAAMPLVDVLEDHKDFYCRLGAATSLGTLMAVDAFDALVDALGDKDDLVRSAANDALTMITKQDMGFDPDSSRNERTRVQRQWRTWFKANEGDLRERLGQPVGSGTPPPAK